MSTEGVDLECGNCGYAWNYTGGKSVHATCPDCQLSVSIEDNRVTAE